MVIPLALVVTGIVGKRSQKLFAQNWKSTGELNAHIEEAFTGHSLVKVFGRQKEVEAEFQVRNQELYKAGFGAQFISGIIMPVMFLVGNLNYVVIAVVGDSPTIARFWQTPLAFLFIDGGHGDDPAWADYRTWEPKLAPGGILAIHDVFPDPADGGRPPYEVWCRAVASADFEPASTTGSLRILRRC